MYGVYRQLEVDKTDHSGNREHFGGYFPEREWAEALAAKLNEEEKEKAAQSGQTTNLPTV
jgi:hypothetical protein